MIHYAELGNSIKMRHYSPNTPKSYTIYTRQFQTFVKSKDSKLIGVEDVTGFLNYPLSARTLGKMIELSPSPPIAGICRCSRAGL